jgi:hypothetical protein
VAVGIKADAEQHGFLLFGHVRHQLSVKAAFSPVKPLASSQV